VKTSLADASRSGLAGEIEVWTDTDVQMPKKRQQPDNDNMIKAAAGITILRLITRSPSSGTGELRDLVHQISGTAPA
jgi:hypothetical protein